MVMNKRSIRIFSSVLYIIMPVVLYFSTNIRFSRIIFIGLILFISQAILNYFNNIKVLLSITLVTIILIIIVIFLNT
jgi:hypothetical protein